jgi:GT2 family glycosyltransferase
MKNIPIFLVNFNRFQPIQDLVQSLLDRKYTNITIVDNNSTYEPLLEWYKTCPVKLYDVGSNAGPYVLNDIQLFKPITSTGTYIWSDGDIVPVKEAPDDFIEHMVKVAIQHNIPKLGLSLVTNDLPDHFKQKEQVIKHESAFTTYGSFESEYGTVYKAPVDTTFAVCRVPDCGYNNGAYRMAWPYSARHAPWYYDSENLPADEILLKKNKLHWCGHWSSM